ncbi:MAG: hypothetical protein Rhims3KO_33420 [Hyphomicrobiales bacterium]
MGAVCANWVCQEVCQRRTMLISLVQTIADIYVTSLCQQMGIAYPNVKTSELNDVDTARDARIGQKNLCANPSKSNCH